ncbi:ATP synthase F1 subunit gamma [Bryobacter aggregatus]|uniref:ATP synthase F1 subunit gamma n=1 Tax=Bryobacter aggregatus TaxID=360054 RepID=UPI0004E0E100|nr:ATP synthase F1 subunit gamma [Bryobacter aggregatus]
MPSLIDLRRRIRSVKNTQQITKAMKMVAAAKLRRAQERVLAARPYSEIYAQMLADVAAAAAHAGGDISHPLLASREEKRILLILVTSDRGLAGAFNTNLIKAAQVFIAEHKNASFQIEAVGRKGRDFFARRDYTFTGEHVGVVEKARFSDAAAIAQNAALAYSDDRVDAVYLIYNEFKSVIAQKLTVSKLLPIAVESSEEPKDYIFEQPPAQLLGTLLPKYVETGIYRAMLESSAAEHAARMTAMDAATTNAADVLEGLTLYLNRVRQASITKEIIEIVSGAAALD